MKKKLQKESPKKKKQNPFSPVGKAKEIATKIKSVMIEESKEDQRSEVRSECLSENLKPKKL